MKTILYIDGFNLYYSAVKDTPLKWLNPAVLVARAFPHNQVVATKCAIVLSGDSDLVTPIRMVRDELKKPIGVLNPQRLSGPSRRPERKSAGLQQAATFYQKGVTWAQLQAAQFPNPMTDAIGTFHKPATW